jgi:hypothetical protein
MSNFHHVLAVSDRIKAWFSGEESHHVSDRRNALFTMHTQNRNFINRNRTFQSIHLLTYFSMKIIATTTVLALVGAAAVTYKCMANDSSTGSVATFELEIAKNKSVRRLATKQISFYAMGDSPYSLTEKDNLPLQLAKLDTSAEFIVHLGDMQDRYVCILELHLYLSIYHHYLLTRPFSYTTELLSANQLHTRNSRPC